MSPDVPGRYSLDTSAILNAWQRNYPPDLFPTLWRNIEGLIDAGVLIASEEVLVELEKKDDEVHAWAKQRPQMFVPIDGQVQQIVTTILRDHPRLIDNRTNRSGADPFVIALAASVGCVVITGERPSGNRTKPKIPDVCQAMDIRCIGIVEFIRDQNWIM
jgi:hypothetical protein